MENMGISMAGIETCCPDIFSSAQDQPAIFGCGFGNLKALKKWPCNDCNVHLQHSEKLIMMKLMIEKILMMDDGCGFLMILMILM
jgi:hypothetical protein